MKKIVALEERRFEETAKRTMVSTLLQNKHP